MRKESLGIFSVLVISLLLISQVSAYDYLFKQSTPVNISIPVYLSDMSISDTSVSCSLLFIEPVSGDLIINGSSLSYSPTGIFNITIPEQLISESGEFDITVNCGNSSDNGFYRGSALVTPTGRESSSFMNNPLFILMIILALIFVGLGIYFSVPALGFIGSILLLLSGIYMMIYGFDNVTNLYTRGGAVTLIGLGIIFMFLAAYEWLGFGGNEE